MVLIFNPSLACWIFGSILLMDEWRVSVWMLAQSVCAAWVCVCIHPLIHHYPHHPPLPPTPTPPPQLPTGTTHFLPTSPSPLAPLPHTFPLSFSHSLSRSLTTPSQRFRGFSWGRKPTSCWASVTHFVRPRQASDAAGRFNTGPTVPF